MRQIDLNYNVVMTTTYKKEINEALKSREKWVDIVNEGTK